KAGANYVSPFAGRIDDFIRKNMGINFNKNDYFPAEGLVSEGKQISDNGIVSGVDLVKKIKKIFENYEIKTKIIAASLRNPRQVMEISQIGVEIATVPFDVLLQMIQHTKTFEGIVKFSEDIVPEYAKIFEV
ncbi:MAG: transaldolase family protein, partial [Candidatus Aenigmatarchaeota archaeon]